MDREKEVNSVQSNLNPAGCRFPGCYMDLKVQKQLSKFLSPEFDVTVNDVGEMINILNAIKAKCASTPEKFRLLIGLLCDVDLSITNIEEHYQQLLVKNRIFHLLKMFPNVAHPLLDVIARATNRCCPLASLPVTIGKLEEERQARNNKFLITCNNTLVPGTTHLLQHSTCLRLSAQTKPHEASTVAGIQKAGVLTPHGLPVTTPFIAQAPPVHVMCMTSSAGQQFVAGNQLTEFNMSRKMYDQVPPSFLQSSLPAGLFNSSGTRESPSDIQKRILQQQQHHLCQQLEILQAQRLQQTCIQNLTSEQQKTISAQSTVLNTPVAIMEQPASASSTVIGSLQSSAQPMRITRSCSQLSRQPIGGVLRNSQGGCDLQALDLRSPERRLASKKSASNNVICKPASSYNLSAEAGNCDESGNIERENKTGEKENGLRLSQVGQHCIVVSIRDGSNLTHEGAVREACKTQEATRLGSERKPAKTKLKQKRGKAGHGCKGAVINVKELCRMQASQKGKMQMSISATEAPSQELKHNTQRQLDDGCAEMSDAALTNNSNNLKFDSELQKSLTVAREQNSTKKRKSEQPTKSAKQKRKTITSEKVLGSTVSESQSTFGNSGIPCGVSKESVPLDVSCTLTPSTNTGNMMATNAAFEPSTGLWTRKPDNENANKTNQPQHQGLEFNQNLEIRSPEAAYLLYSGCDDEVWYQSSQSDELDILSNQSLASPTASQSNVRMSSPLQPGSFLERLADQQKSDNSPSVFAVTAEEQTAPKQTFPRTREEKKKKKR